MNNSFLTLEQYRVNLGINEPVDHTELFVEREGELVKVIAAIRSVAKTKEWSTLKENVFGTLAATLERELASEAKKESPDTLKLNRLAGQLKWAERYADLSKLENVFKTELTNVRQKLYGKAQKD